MLELTLRATAILASAWLLARALPRATAATRHLIWHAAIVAVLAAPLLSPIAPRFRLPLLSRIAQAPLAVPVARAPLAPARGALVQQVREAQPVREMQERLQPRDAVAALAVLGTLLMTTWFLTGWIISARRVRRATPAPLHWQLEVNALCQKLRVTREVRLRVMSARGSPLAAGLWRAAILLPQGSAAWSADRRRAVLLHELAHIRRRDCRVQLLTQAACALYWFDPFVWIAAARLRSERERACDDEVLQSGAAASSYAAHLLDIARDLTPALRPSAALAMARPSELEGRLLAVLADRARMPRPGTRWAIASLIGAVTVVALGASTATPATPSAAAVPARFLAGIAADDLSPQDRAAATRARVDAKATLQASPDPGLRERAVVDLVRRADPDTVGSLKDALKDSSQDVREKAALGLAFMSGPEVIPALLDALHDPDSQVREKAAIGLALRRDETIVEPLIAALQDPDSQVREKVAIALGTSGDPRARAALTDALRDGDSQVREKAAAALVLLGLTR